ncbi:MAG: XRE family transcriptional regulator [Alphaproteobacteria bacterium]|jgi:transcriptional regulator with XRE-family HTH domain|nr:XRE family transcriptional regulator [Alphaproteobacteria bacterium]
MATLNDDLTERIASRVRIEREARKWSLAEVAEHSGVSKAMISKIERAESSPTTTVLGRLCGAFGLTLSTFLTRAEEHAGRLIRAAEQPHWTDPETGSVRTLVSPAAGGPIEMVAVDLPAGAEVLFPASLYAVFHQVVWVLGGRLTLVEGETEHDLKVGDCLELGPPSECRFRNQSNAPCRYLVAAVRRG